jgi:uncharacterized protein
MTGYILHHRAAAIIQDAGGELIGRTRLQKVTYLAQLVGFSDDFSFEYKHYGPYSEELAEAMEIATGLSLVEEDERRADWGGRYSIYSSHGGQVVGYVDDAHRRAFVRAAANIGAIELELAATAAFLYSSEGFGQNGKGDPWVETARRKPEKASEGRLERAKVAYLGLAQLPVPQPLPHIA